MSQALIKAARVSIAGNVMATMQVKFQQRCGLNIEDIYKEDIGHPVLLQITHASRKAFRGKTQLFAKNDMGGLMVRNDDTDR